MRYVAQSFHPHTDYLLARSFYIVCYPKLTEVFPLLFFEYRCPPVWLFRPLLPPFVRLLPATLKQVCLTRVLLPEFLLNQSILIQTYSETIKDDKVKPGLLILPSDCTQRYKVVPESADYACIRCSEIIHMKAGEKQLCPRCANPEWTKASRAKRVT